MNQIVFNLDTILRTLLIKKQRSVEEKAEAVPPSTYVDFHGAGTRAGKSAKASQKPKRKSPRSASSRRIKKPN